MLETFEPVALGFVIGIVVGAMLMVYFYSIKTKKKQNDNPKHDLFKNRYRKS